MDMSNDAIANALSHTERRRKISKVADDDIEESGLGVYAQEEVSPLPWLRLVGGLRADYFGFDVTDDLQQLSDSVPSTSGVKSSSIFSPKLNAILGPFYKTEFYLNYGQGFHSNDARGVVRSEDPVTPLTKATGYEVGLRTAAIPRLDLAASLWRLDMRSELVWVGDEGGTEARGPTRRIGYDAEARVQVLPWLWLDADLTQSDAVYTGNAGNGDAVALAPTTTFAGGVSARHRSGLKGSLRVQSIADRPATEDESLTAEGFTVVDLGLGYRWRNVEADLSVANLFDTEWREAQFANESRLKSEAAPVQDIHFVPGTPFQAQGGVRVYF
jgi:outer membrane receptor protein involved in Fe transport